MGRADSILGRFPAHFEALKPGKVLRSAVAALARDLDVQAAELAAIRRSHRVSDADVLSDLLLIAARHGIMASSLELLTMRFERARSLLKNLVAAADAAARDEAAARLLALWSLEGGEPKLALFADRNEDGSPVELTGEAGRTADRRGHGSEFPPSAERRGAHPHRHHDPHRGERQRHRAGAVVRRGERA
jgi:hypothetical protein